MRIQELKEGIEAEEPVSGSVDDVSIMAFNPKRAMVGFGARFLFYPTLLYNVMRNKIQVEFRWWDEVDQFLLLGAVPFPGDVPHLKQLGVGGVVTLNEPYETLVPTSLFHVVDSKKVIGSADMHHGLYMLTKFSTSKSPTYINSQSCLWD